MPADRPLTPQGWKPRPGAHVRILARTGAAPDEPPPPPGVWWVIDRCPAELAHAGWWVLPRDDEARSWSSQQRRHERYGNALPVPGRQLTPARTAVRA